MSEWKIEWIARNLEQVVNKKTYHQSRLKSPWIFEHREYHRAELNKYKTLESRLYNQLLDAYGVPKLP